MKNSNITLYLAEVISNELDSTYRLIDDESEYDNTDFLYTIRVTLYGSGVVNTTVPAKPYNLHNLTIPAVGEHVVVFNGYSNYNQEKGRREQWYYLPVIGVQSNIQNNLLPGLSGESNTVDKNLPDLNISPMQVYMGDVISQGRWGNSIRLGSSINSNTYNRYSKIPTWSDSDSNPGNPIIVLSNTKTHLPGKQFVIESADKDYSSLWLTSTQTVTMTLNNTLRKTNRYESQLIGTADRIILKSKSDIVALDSKIAVEINAPITSFGVSETKEEMLHSTVIVEVISSMINIISAGNIDASGNISNPVLASKLSELQSKLLGNAFNKKMLQDKES